MPVIHVHGTYMYARGGACPGHYAMVLQCTYMQIHALMWVCFCSELCGLCEADPSADWWSLGAILFEILTGKVHLVTLTCTCTVPIHALYMCVYMYTYMYVALPIVYMYMLCTYLSRRWDKLEIGHLFIFHVSLCL